MRGGGGKDSRTVFQLFPSVKGFVFDKDRM